MPSVHICRNSVTLTKSAFSYSLGAVGHLMCYLYAIMVYTMYLTLSFCTVSFDFDATRCASAVESSNIRSNFLTYR